MFISFILVFSSWSLKGSPKWSWWKKFLCRLLPTIFITSRRQKGTQFLIYFPLFYFFKQINYEMCSLSLQVYEPLIDLSSVWDGCNSSPPKTSAIMAKIVVVNYNQNCSIIEKVLTTEVCLIFNLFSISKYKLSFILYFYRGLEV